MAGVINEAPHEESGGFKALWTGSPQFDLPEAMDWSAKAYHFYSRFFADPVEPRYRIFLRENPYNPGNGTATRSEEHTSELQSLMRISYAVFCLKKKN